jgi:hypothetical protein
VFLSHQSPGTSAPTGTAAALRSSYLRLNTLSTNPVPSFVLLNVKVRARVAGTYATFGPACRLKVDPTANCQLTQLTTTADPVISCGATGLNLNGVDAIHAVAVPGANRYQFRFTRQGYTRNIAVAGRTLVLAEWTTNPLQLGLCYDVTVRVSFDNGTTWCGFGPSCSICLVPPPPQGATRELQASTSGALTVWPNPTDDERVTLMVDDLGQEHTTAVLELNDLYGKRVRSTVMPVNGRTLNTVLDLDGLASGLYLVTVTAGDTRFTQRLVIR